MGLLCCGGSDYEMKECSVRNSDKVCVIFIYSVFDIPFAIKNAEHYINDERTRSRFFWRCPPALVGWVVAVIGPRLAHRFITVFVPSRIWSVFRTACGQDLVWLGSRCSLLLVARRNW